MAYADDIVVSSSTVKGTQSMLTRLEVCRSMGLIINVDKMKAISIKSTLKTHLYGRSGVM
jgi:hypothetical protein